MADYSDWQKGVVSGYQDSLLYNEQVTTTGTHVTSTVDVSQAETVTVNLRTSGDAAGDVWTMFVSFISDTGAVVYQVYSSTIGDVDTPNSNAGRLEMTIPVRGTKVRANLVPSGKGVSAVNIRSTNRRLLTPNVRGGNLYQTFWGVDLQQANIAAGATQLVPVGTTSGQLSLVVKPVSPGLTVAVEGFSSVDLPGQYRPVWSGPASPAGMTVPNLNVPADALRLRLTNTTNVALAVSLTAWALH